MSPTRVFAQSHPNEDEVKTLVGELKNKHDYICVGAIESLGNLKAKTAIPGLILALKDDSSYVSSKAAEALGNIDDSTPYLLEVLRDKNPTFEGVRLKEETERKPPAIGAPKDFDKQKDDEERLALKIASIRSRAATALGKLKAFQAIDDLRQILTDKSEEQSLRATAATVLGLLNASDAQSVRSLDLALDESNPSDVRASAAESLGKLSVDSAAADLVRVLDDNNSRTIAIAAESIGRLKVADAIPKLVSKWSVPDLFVCDKVSGAIYSILESQLIQGRESAFLDIVLEGFKKNENRISVEIKRNLQATIEQLSRAANQQNVFVSFYYRFPTTVLMASSLASLFMCWLLLLLLYPLGLLLFFEKFPLEAQASVFGFLKIPLQSVLTFGIFRKRVLDAWVSKHIGTARLGFLQKRTVKERRSYVSFGVDLEGESVSDFSATDLREIFDKNQVKVLVHGEGGIGKTSLICQIANWAMSEKKNERLFIKHMALPILLEQNFSEDGNTGFPQASHVTAFRPD